VSGSERISDVCLSSSVDVIKSLLTKSVVSLANYMDEWKNQISIQEWT